jgi:hypothetical protein
VIRMREKLLVDLHHTVWQWEKAASAVATANQEHDDDDDDVKM